MIVHPKPNLFNILIMLKGSVAKRIAKPCIFVAMLASIIVAVEQLYPAMFSKVNATPFTLLGISLSIFMSFRNNACYDRWWEGRKAWGIVIAETRSFIRQSIIIEDAKEREVILLGLCGFAHALNARLRSEDEMDAARAWLVNLTTTPRLDISNSIIKQIGKNCSNLAKNKKISEWRYTMLEKRLSLLTDAQAACERIKHTPLPFPYTLLLHRTIVFFCVLLPFAMAEPLGWLTPIFTTIVSYTFFGLDAIGDELENPFGRDENDLPTDSFVRVIERDILEALGRTDIPPPLYPQDYVLS